MRYRWVAKTKIKNESSALNDVRWTTNGISLFDFSEFLAATRSFNNKSCKVFRMMSHKSVYLGKRCCRIIITAFLPYVCINVGNKVYLMEEIEKSLLMFLTVWHTTWNHPWRKRMREISHIWYRAMFIWWHARVWTNSFFPSAFDFESLGVTHFW